MNMSDVYTPEFQSLVTDKGGMIFHMLRWVMGDQDFDRSVKEFMFAYDMKATTAANFQTIAEKNHGDKLTAFFSQWVDGTGAPEFKLKYTTFRIQKGIRIVGQISQDLDLFRMPLELMVDTDGLSEPKHIGEVGTEAPVAVVPIGRPQRLTR